MTEPTDFSALLNANLGGWNTAMGLQFTRASADECVGTVAIAEIHRQPYGIVHGGVHAGIIEAACSTGAPIAAMARGPSVVGLENATSENLAIYIWNALRLEIPQLSAVTVWETTDGKCTYRGT